MTFLVDANVVRSDESRARPGIAATAPAHGLTVAIRNRGDFTKAGVEVVDLFEPES